MLFFLVFLYSFVFRYSCLLSVSSLYVRSLLSFLLHPFVPPQFFFSRTLYLLFILNNVMVDLLAHRLRIQKIQDSNLGSGSTTLRGYSWKIPGYYLMRQPPPYLFFPLHTFSIPSLKKPRKYLFSININELCVAESRRVIVRCFSYSSYNHVMACRRKKRYQRYLIVRCNFPLLH